MLKSKQLIMLIATGAVLAASSGLTSCASTKAPSEPARGDVIIGMPNPFITSKTLEEASALVGFSMELPAEDKIPAWVTTTVYKTSTVDTKLLEVIYAADDTFAKEIRIRKAISDKEDISGDYTDYEKEETVILEDKTISAKSNGGKLYLATWEEGEFSYSVRFSDGVTATELEEFVELIK